MDSAIHPNSPPGLSMHQQNVTNKLSSVLDWNTFIIEKLFTDGKKSTRHSKTNHMCEGTGFLKLNLNLSYKILFVEYQIEVF